MNSFEFSTAQKMACRAVFRERVEEGKDVDGAFHWEISRNGIALKRSHITYATRARDVFRYLR